MTEAPSSYRDIEAEFAVLGAVIYDNAALERIDGLEAHHFSEGICGRLWTFCVEKSAQGRFIEPLLIRQAFETDPGFIDLGGAAFIAQIVDTAPPAANAPDYAAIVTDMALRRELVRVADDLTVSVGDGATPASAHLERAEQDLFSLAESRTDGAGVVDFGSALDGALDQTAKAYAKDGAVSGVSTGLIDLDRKLGGLHPSDLLILAGRPSMGKTALATNIAYSVVRHGGRVLFFSLEMSAEQLSQRILAEVTGISSDRQRKGEVTDAEFGLLRDTVREIRQSGLRIDATGGLQLHKLAARARREKRRGGLDLIVVDYLQLIRAAGKMESRVQEVSIITQALKALAKELNLPVLALSQLSRQVEAREDKRPQLSDLRESGSIEQDADCVMFVFREAYYIGRAEPKPGTKEHDAWTEALSEAEGKADLIIGKQRHGPIGTVKLVFDDRTTKFSNLAREGQFDVSGGRLPYSEREH